VCFSLIASLHDSVDSVHSVTRCFSSMYCVCMTACYGLHQLREVHTKQSDSVELVCVGH